MAKLTTPQDMYDAWQKMVNPGGYPMQGMFSIPDSKDIERKLNELAVVEHWLKANVDMVQLTQKTLQYQLSMLKGGEKATEMMGKIGRPDPEPVDPPNPAAWMWNMMAESMKMPKPPAGKRRKKT